MKAFVRLASIAFLVLASTGLAPAANQRDIDAAVKRGQDYLLNRYKAGQIQGDDGHGIGSACLAGLALLESNTPFTEQSLKNIVAGVREASYSEHKTYQVALCLFFLDRLGEADDVPRIQMLGARLLTGQNANGGWGYDCCAEPTDQDKQRLRAMKPIPPAASSDPKKPTGQLHPDIGPYLQSLAAAARGRERGDDNSNTQFGILGLWMARKHGLPVDSALDLIEKRFLATQNANGGWGYQFTANSIGSPSMACAGILALSTSVARREERRLKAVVVPKDVNPKGGAKGNDPFFNPPPPKEKEKKEGGLKAPRDAKDVAVQAAFNHLAVVLTTAARGPAGTLLRGAGHGNGDLYFLWSLERACVIFGVDKIGGIDWYDFGADAILPRQNPDGSWRTHYSNDVDTAFAMLFLLKANLARDLSSRVKGDPTTTELRAGAGPLSGAPPAAPMPTPMGGGKEPVLPDIPLPKLPAPVDDETAKLATELVRSVDYKKALEKFRDSKGSEYTKALTAAVYRLDGDRKKQAREALAERLTRMTAATLRTMMASEDAELRRGAVLACAMKDDKSHVPDLIDRLTDSE
ncbi:MAG TPA: hypothetical protein VMZ71_05965, partial [Gemmataceae bacterium]|nr:hypothetical protein [Gemmataceae bacterium]